MKLKVWSNKYEDYSHFNNDYSSTYEFIDHCYKWDWDELEIIERCINSTTLK